MSVYYELYRSKYYNSKDELNEMWQSGIRTLPFASNVQSVFDSRCGLSGLTGLFLRLISKDGVKPIDNIEESLVKPLGTYLKNLRWDDTRIAKFIDVVRDQFEVNGNLNLSKVAFMKYHPVAQTNYFSSEKERNKYVNGTKKIANLLYALGGNVTHDIPGSDSQNLFMQIVESALKENIDKEDTEELFYTPVFLRKNFQSDLEWLLSQEDCVIQKYLSLFLYYYAALSIIHTLIHTSYKECKPAEKCDIICAILKGEKASENHDAVIDGWMKVQPKDQMNTIFGRVLAMDICNSILGGNIGFYHEIIAKFNETQFEENKEVLEKILSKYQEDKRYILTEKRKNEKSLGDPIPADIQSYEEFIKKLEHLCCSLQSNSYVTRLKKKVYDFLAIRLIELRRSNYVMTIDNELLIFLIALSTKSKKTKLENVYKLLQNYGLRFNRASRQAIETYLLKLNLLDRKSDSGEAQYVKVVL